MVRPRIKTPNALDGLSLKLLPLCLFLALTIKIVQWLF